MLYLFRVFSVLFALSSAALYGADPEDQEEYRDPRSHQAQQMLTERLLKDFNIASDDATKIFQELGFDEAIAADAETLSTFSEARADYAAALKAYRAVSREDTVLSGQLVQAARQAREKWKLVKSEISPEDREFAEFLSQVKKAIRKHIQYFEPGALATNYVTSEALQTDLQNYANTLQELVALRLLQSNKKKVMDLILQKFTQALRIQLHVYSNLAYSMFKSDRVRFSELSKGIRWMFIMSITVMIGSALGDGILEALGAWDKLTRQIFYIIGSSVGLFTFTMYSFFLFKRLLANRRPWRENRPVRPITDVVSEHLAAEGVESSVALGKTLQNPGALMSLTYAMLKEITPDEKEMKGALQCALTNLNRY